MLHQDHTEALITNHERRLQKLKELQSLYGMDTPVHILIEIENTETEIKSLLTKLEAFRDNRINDESRQPPSVTIDTNSKQKRVQIHLDGDILG